MEAFAPLVVTALTKVNGKFCMTGSRVLVQRSVADAWRERIASLLEKVVVGRADDPNTQLKCFSYWPTAKATKTLARH
jgi:acyl-CoA reductase-like NAD-dependent aldehyde dehydrogenase